MCYTAHMKIRWKSIGFLRIIIYLAFCSLVVYLWDFVLPWKQQFLTNMVVGLLTITGGFLLAWWLIEEDRIKKDEERLQKELERKRRVLSKLQVFKNSLWTWLFEYANALSAEYKLYEESVRISSGNYRSYKNYIPQLEDIFGIGTFDKSGKRLRGTDAFDSQAFFKIPLSPQFLYSHLYDGLREIKQIESQIKELPSFVEEVDPKVATIVNFSELIESRIRLLEKWEKRMEKQNRAIIDDSSEGAVMKSNLRTAGRRVLNIAIAIDANLDKLEAELNQNGKEVA